VNDALSLWDRAWFRRTGYAVAGAVFLIGLVVLLNVRSQSHATTAPVVPGSPGYEEQLYGRKIDVPKDAVAIGRHFIHDTVLRQDLADGWALATPKLRGSLTRQQWLTGNIPVEPFAAGAYNGTSYKVVHARSRSVLLLLLLSSDKSGTRSGEFFMELVPSGGTWKVNYWGPRGTTPPVPAARP